MAKRDGYVYHLQQCVEKLFKACLLQQGQTFQRTHDLVNGTWTNWRT